MKLPFWQSANQIKPNIATFEIFPVFSDVFQQGLSLNWDETELHSSICCYYRHSQEIINSYTFKIGSGTCNYLNHYKLHAQFTKA